MLCIAEETEDHEIVLPHVYTYVDLPVVEQREVLTSEEIEALHVESLPSLFGSLGLQTLGYGAYGSQSNPSVRGFTGGTVRVVVDGVPMNSSQNGNFDFTSINPSDIEKIEVVRCAFTEDLAGEGAVGGVIYITTKTQRLGQHFSFGGSAKSYFNANVPLDTFASDFAWNGQLAESTFAKASVNGTFAQNKFLYKNYAGKIRERDGSAVKDGNADLSLTHYFGNGNSFGISNLFYGGYKNLAQGGVQEDYNNTAQISLLFPALNAPALSSPVNLKTSLAWKSANEWYDAERSEHHLNEVNADFSASAKIFPWWSEMAGLHAELDMLDSTNTGSHTIVSGTFKETSKLFLGEHVSVSIPLSLSFSNRNVAFVPKLGLRFDVPHVSILLDGYRMASFPTMNQLYWSGAGAVGNENLVPENGWGGELTLNVQNSILPLSLCLYTNWYENSIHWGVQDGIWTPLNLRSAFYAGLDFASEKTLWNFLTLRGKFEYLYNRLLDKTDSATYGKMIMYTPDIVASLSATLTLSFMSILVEANYTGKRYEDNQNIYALDPYLLLNASAELKVWKHVRPYLRADNILNVDYESVPNYPMPGVSLTAGLRCAW